MADEYVELPVVLIQHIQSFLDVKDFARSSLLSKLWHNAWLTHPTLRLDERRTNKKIDFPILAMSSIKRYQKLNTRLLNSFNLCMSNILSVAKTLLTDKLILDALNLGVIHFSMNEYCNSNQYTLPVQVFSSLKDISVTGCRIDSIELKSRLLCSRLVSLELRHVWVEDDTMRNILSGCSLIENLELDCCKGLEKVNLSVARRYLNTFRARGSVKRKLLVEWEEKKAGYTADVQHQYCNLMALELDFVQVDDMFFSMFSYRFPCLDELTLLNYGDRVDVEFVSSSLRYLRFLPARSLKFVKIHLPNIRNLSFGPGTDDMPYLSFSTDSEDWNSDLEFVHHVWTYNGFWFMKIRDILTELRLSKISLVMDLSEVNQAPSSMGDFSSITPSPFVEILTIKTCRRKSRWFGVSFGWLWCCRPKFVTWINTSTRKPIYKTLALVYNELKKHENKISTDTLQYIPGLEEVDMEYYEEGLREWRPVSQEAIEAPQIRLRLKWSS